MDRIGSRVARGVVCAAIVLCFAGALWGVEFAGGTGAPNDPYQIATLEQLVAIGSDQNLAQSDYVLVADIDLSFPPWSEPVIPAFGGTLDGRGYAIRGFRARGPGLQGLFGQIGNPGRVSNLHIVDADLTATNAVGALAAYNAGIIHNCYCQARITGTGYDAGGLVGSNSGTITGSHSEADVVGYMRVGGLAGSNPRGIISDCHSIALVLGSAGVGGLVGENAGSVSASYSDSEVEGEITLGGLVGNNSGAVSSCYSVGNVTGGTYAGGLVGFNGGEVDQCYSLAVVASPRVPADADIGGLVGRNITGTGKAMRDSYFLAPGDGGGPDNGIGTPLTLAQMEQRASFAGWGFWGRQADAMHAHWFMPPDSPPVLVWQTEITGLQLVPDVAGLTLDRAQASLATAGFVPGDLTYDYDRALPADFAIHAEPGVLAPVGDTVGLVLSTGTLYDWTENAGDGTDGNPYQIETAGQLESLGDRPELWDSHFVLTATLDMAGRTYATALIAPDTSRTTDDFQGTPFTGVFDGQGHTIRNLTIFADDREYVGLFGLVGQTGHITGLKLRNATVRSLPPGLGIRPRGTSFVGVLAGYNKGTLANCSVTDSLLLGRTSEGGLVGVNQGEIIDCYVDIAVVSVSSSVRR